MKNKVRCFACNRGFRTQRGLNVHNRVMHPIIPEERQLPAPEPLPPDLRDLGVVQTMTNSEVKAYIQHHIDDLGTNMVGLLQFYLILSQSAREVSGRLAELLSNDFPQIT